MAWTHRIESIDVKTRTGTCAACGLVPLRYRKDRDRWMCAPGAKEQRKGERPRTGRWGWRRLLGPEEYAARLDQQGGCCAICSTEIVGTTGHVDHDHGTGAVRGILCRGCNLGIGHLQDDVARLAAAIRYLNATKPPT